MKKLAALLLALVMMLGVVPVGVAAEEAEQQTLSPIAEEACDAACGMADFALTQEGNTGNDCAASEKGTLTLTQLRKKFPDGKYWNHMGSSSNNQEGWTNTPCNHSAYGTAYCNAFSINGADYSWQCMGFAEKLGYDATGYNPRVNANGWYTYEDPSALDNVKPGDIVRYSTHSIYVIDVYGDNIICAHCNNDGHCVIQWDAVRSKTMIRNNFVHLRSAPFSMVDGYISQCTQYPCYATITAKPNAKLWTLPCSDSTNPESQNPINCSSSGESFTTAAIYKNTYSEPRYWYRVTKNGNTYYLYAGNVTNVSLQWDVSISNPDAPSSLTQGSSYSIGGMIYTNILQLSYVSSYVYSGSSTSGTALTGTYANINTSSYSLRNSALSNGTVYSGLPTGTYTTVFAAKAINNYSSDGTTLQTSTRTYSTLYTKQLTVNAPAPSVYTLDVNGYLNREERNGLYEFGTVDVYINGALVAQGVNDYCAAWPVGTTYEIRNIQPNPGYSYHGIYSGSRYGTIDGNTYVSFEFFYNDFTAIVPWPEPQVFNGHTYYLYTGRGTWHYSKQLCELFGGHLVTITSSEENAFVQSLVAQIDETIWIGAYADSSRNWNWVTDEGFSFAQWYDGEPNNYPTIESDLEEYGTIDANGYWNDNGGFHDFCFICEYDYDLTMTLDDAMNSQCDLTYITSSDYPFTYETIDGFPSGVSGNGGVPDSESWISTRTYLSVGDKLTFWYQYSTDSGYDLFRFYANDEEIFCYSGESNGWILYEYSAPTSGLFKFVWSYTKDSVVNLGYDRVVIDDVSITYNDFDRNCVEGVLNDYGMSFQTMTDYSFSEDYWYGMQVVTSMNFGVDDSSATMQGYTIMNAGDIFEFDYLLSTEENWDWFNIYDNGVLVYHLSGDSGGWNHVQLTAEESGQHVYIFEYLKDSILYSGLDCVKLKGFNIIRHTFDPVIISTNPDPAVANPGEAVTVSVDLYTDTVYEAHYIEMHIYYDPSNLIFESWEYGWAFPYLPNDCIYTVDLVSPGDLYFSIICPTISMTQIGQLVNLKFRVLQSCTMPQSIQLGYVHVAYYGAWAFDIPAATYDSTIYIRIIPGDVNGDLQVTFLDITVLYYFIIGETELSAPQLIAADFDHDGQISFLDVSALSLFLLG